MPSKGQPFLSLRSIIIVAGDIKAIFPAGLPNLEQLVIRCSGYTELEFEDPQAFASALTSFYIMGDPLVMAVVDVARMSCSLARRGLTMDAALMQPKRSCIYLRLINAAPLAVKELSGRVDQLVYECTCRACSACLRRAGCQFC